MSSPALAGGWRRLGVAGDRGESPGRRQHRSARAAHMRPRRVHAADHTTPGIQTRAGPGRLSAVTTPSGTSFLSMRSPPALRTRRRRRSPASTTIDELAAAAVTGPARIRCASAGTGTVNPRSRLAKLIATSGIAAVHTAAGSHGSITQSGSPATRAGHTTLPRWLGRSRPPLPTFRTAGSRRSGSAQRRRSRACCPNLPAAHTGLASPVFYSLSFPGSLLQLKQNKTLPSLFISLFPLHLLTEGPLSGLPSELSQMAAAAYGGSHAHEPPRRFRALR